MQIYDSAGNFCVGEMTVTAQNNGSKYILTLTAPEEFMTDPDTVYPVTIDPTIEVSDNISGGSIEDSVIYSGTPNANYGGFTYLTVGYNGSTYGIGRALFRLPGLYNSTAYTSVTGAQIQSVYFYAWDASGHDDLPIELYPVLTSGWTESGVTWNNAPGYYTGTDVLPRISTEMPSNDYGCFDITALVKWWKSGNYASANCGFILKNPNETSETYKKVPCSSETAVTSRRPYVVMTYAAEASIVSSRDYVTGGTTLSLSVSSDDTVQSVTWASSDSSIATITQNGLLFGSNVGSVIITATVTFSDNTTCVAEKLFFVTVPNGVYRIANKSSGRYLNVNEGMINDFAQVTQYSSTANEDTLQEQFQQMWKINYIGNGLYTLRPYHKLDMCLYSYGANDFVYIRQTAASDADVIGVYQWSIEWLNGGYVIKRSGDSANTLQIEGGSNAQSARARTESYVSTATTCHWIFSQVLNPATGILLYDTATQKQVNASDVTLYIAPGETGSLSDLGVCAAFYSPTIINQTFTLTSCDSSYASVNSTGQLVGVSPGSLTVRASLGGRTVVLNAVVTEIANGTYYILNKKSGLTAEIDSDATLASGTNIEQHIYSGETVQQWIITRYQDDYYTIKSASATAYYMGVDGDSVSSGDYVELHNEAVTDGMLWKISTTSSGSYKLSPKNGEASGYALALGEDNSYADIELVVTAYNGAYNYIDEWCLITQVDVSLIAIPESYDRSSYFDDIVADLATIGYDNYYHNDDYVNTGVTEGELICRMANSRITLVRTHGTRTQIEVTDHFQGTAAYLTISDMIDLYDGLLVYSELIVLGACYTASVLENDPSNLIKAIDAEGARTVIGFENSVYYTACNAWCAKFFELYAQDYNDSSKTIRSVCDETDSAMKSHPYYEKTEKDDNGNDVLLSVKNFVIEGEETFP